jgi:hypothetical protein
MNADPERGRLHHKGHKDRHKEERTNNNDLI